MSNSFSLPSSEPNGARFPPNLDLQERSILPPGLGFWGKVWFWIKFWLFVKTARLRFIAILAVIGGTIAYWDTLRAYYEKWTRPAGKAAVAAADTEFWCPMHPTIIRDHPDNCPICGMPLSKRHKGKDGPETLPPGVVSRVQLTPYRVALAGIQTSAIAYQPLSRDIETVGFVEFDERKLARITARLTGRSRIDQLYVNVTGQMVRKGEPLAQLYNPDLVVTVQNLLNAQRAGNSDLQRGARDRLRLWGIEDDQIAAILRTGQPITHLTIRSPIDGHVIKKYQVEGEYIEEGSRLYDVVDLSTVWIEAQVYEDELGFLREGLSVSATTRAYPNRNFQGKLAFIHPHLDISTRTLRVRFDVDNPHHVLRPGMYAAVRVKVPATQLESFTDHMSDEWRNQTAVELLGHALLAPAGPASATGLESLLRMAVQHALGSQGLVLAVPERAVIDTGNRKLVYREAGPNVYEGVEVRLGPRMGDFYSVIQGVTAGEKVATAGSFLIDAETRLTSGAGSTYFGASGGPQGERHSATTARTSATTNEDATVSASLAKLSAADRRLAEAQGFCVVQEANRLGSMGIPAKIMIKGQPVFLCCSGCEEEARAHPDQTLARVAKLKARKKTPAPK